MKRRPAYTYFFHASLLMLYAAFLAVQVFFNFDTTSNSTVSFNQYFGKQQSVKKKATHSSQTVRFRLNKRFQPANIPAIQCSVEIPFPQYISVLRYAEYNAATLSSVFLCRSLRAPPVMA